ncbi:MAG: signal transduction protein [Halothiobacillaceae bacterium]|nr:MAG: signal transduction protein [Halothiobacillaceae bacterium]
MSVAATVIRFLDRQQVAYTVHNLIHFESIEDAANRLGIAKHSLIYTVPLIDQFGLILTILPADRAISFTQLNGLMGRNFTPASTTQTLAVFRDCDCAYLPPLGEAYGVRAILEDSVVDSKVIYFIAGDSRHIIQVNSQGFLHLQNQACIASNFTAPNSRSADVESAATDAVPTKSKIREALTTLGALPPMPEMAQQIFGLSANPYAGAKELAEIISLDPSLSAQVLRYARSPLFGYQGELDSIQTAISRVLGFDMVMNLALGLATAKPFRVQRSGPLGLDNFWRHAIYSAALVQALGKELSADKRPNPGLAYLSGLLHNFGHLLMGHLAKQEFAQLNELVLEYPNVAVVDIEERLLGVSHDEVGGCYWRITC